jgi:NAD-dependent dihydropyrimidine dehydrogenase PreA subunit/nitroreductase
MVKQLHIVDTKNCNADGLCVEVCPRDAIEVVDGAARTVEGRAETCILCGQCVAVCPTEALGLQTMPEEEFDRLKKRSFGFEEFHEFLRTRRSVRLFKDRSVSKEIIEKILAAAATAPMGMPPHTTEVVVLDRPDELDLLLKDLVRHYDGMIKAFSNPIGRAMIRLSTGPEVFGELRGHVIEAATRANEAYRRDRTDRYTWGAPALMVFHANRWGSSYRENAHLVCHHAMLAAVSLGLGTTIIGMIPPVIERSRDLRERYGIPKENKVLTSLIVGHPKYRYKKSIRRDLAGVTFA